jgi:hypothetical protein
VEDIMPGVEHWTVDHVGASQAVLVDDKGRAVTLSLSDLPAGLEKLAVLTVEVPENGVIDWSRATVDTEETDRRRRSSEDISRRLRLSDPQGFIYMPDE